MRAMLRRWLGVEDELSALAAENNRLQLRLAAARERLSTVSSGVDVIDGRFDYESNSRLKGAQRHDTLDVMVTDAHVKGALRAAILPLVNANWAVDPASDDPRDVEIAEFVSANLLRRGGKKYSRDYWSQTPWNAQHLIEILEFLTTGFSMFAKSWRQVGSKVVLDRVQWLEPRSVDPSGWVLSGTDEILGVKRTFRTPTGAYEFRGELEKERLALYVWEMKGARFEGTSFLRSMYGAWYRKDQLLRQAIIFATRLGAPPPLGYYPDGYSEAEVRQFQQFVLGLRGTANPESAGVFRLGDGGVEPIVKYAGADVGEIDRLGSLLDQENAEIAHAGGTKSYLLGETSSGSRSLGDSIGKYEMNLIKAIGEVICEQVNHGVANLPGLIEELVERNFAGVQSMPELKVQGIDPDEATKNIPTMLDAIAKKALPPLPEIQEKLATALGLDIPIELFEQAQADEQARQEAEQKAQVESLRQTNEQAPDDEQQGSLAAKVARFGRLLAPAPGARPVADGGRAPNVIEAKACNLAAVAETLRTGESSVLAEMRRAQRRMVEEIVNRVASGKVTKRNVGSQRQAKFRGMARSEAALLPLVTAVGMDGARHAAAELAAQRGAQLAAGDDAVTVSGRKLLVSVLDEFAETAKVVVQLNLSKLWERLLAEALDQFLRLALQGLEGDDMVHGVANFLEGLSEKPLEDVARKTATVAYNQGRDMAAETAKSVGAAEWAVRSEVLDARTCDACSSLDGTVEQIGTPGYQANMPPSKCQGGERCRGFYVVLDKATTDRIDRDEGLR